MGDVVRISCDVDERAHIADLSALQKNLKSLSEENYKKLKTSIIRHGITMPIHVWENDGRLWILDGHQRKFTLEKMESEGCHIPEIPIVKVMAPSMQQAKEILLSMVSQYGHVERQGLYEFMSEADMSFAFIDENYDLPETNMESFRVEYFDDNTVAPKGCDEDETPELPKESKVRFGDIFELGNHRLLCGDSTSIDTIEKLMDGEKADITFTSPPYNVGKTPNGNENKYLTYDDHKTCDDYKKLLQDFTTNCLMVTDYVFSNIQSLAGNKVALIEYLYLLRDKYADTIIWDKETAEPAMARRVLNSQFEYIHIFSNEAKRTVGKRDFRVTLTNVFRLNSRAGKEFAKIHKATFRVELPQFFIENFTESSCLDPFGGTGTTLIACEKTNRKCFTIELDPKYCAVILNRWEKYSGKQAYLLAEDGSKVAWQSMKNDGL